MGNTEKVQEEGKKFTVKNSIYLDKKFIKKGSEISLTEAQVKGLKGTNIEKELIPVEKTETK